MMKKLTIAAALLLVLAGCYNDKYDKLYPATATTTCDTTTIKYSSDIQPIINSHCAISGGCHNAAGDANTGNLDFTIFSTLQSQATAALMLNDINFTPAGKGHNAMPLSLPKILQCDIDKITRWVNEGAPDN